MSVERREADLVVVGTGVAGLTAALGADGARVHLLSKGGLESGSSPWAQGGVAAAVGRGDSPELHAADTVAAGAGLVDPEVAEIVTRDGVLAVRRLVEIGAEFDRGARGELALGREAAHSRSRIVHAGGDKTGAELVRTLAERVRREPRIELFDRAFAARVVTEGGRVAGLLARHRGGRWIFHASPRVVLATGGLGQLYRYTTNPAESTGDGLLLAAEAGARLVDVEFVQFHPTALVAARDPLPLLTEALRGEGATLLDGDGRRFMPDEHADAELAPRDVVARAIWRRLAAGQRVVLDATRALGERLPARFPQVYAACREAGFDPRIEPLPVVPAAHYFMGGVAVDAFGRASVEGLWACGEAASTGVHGANRLASNSLLEALVFGARVAASAADLPARPRPLPVVAAPPDLDPIAAAPELRRELRELAWSALGLVRDGDGLAAAWSRLDALWSELPAGASEVRNLVGAARCIAEAAHRRRESRGAHYRTDFPHSRAEWQTRQAFVATVETTGVRLDFEAPPRQARA
ncbi:MAG: L-aspartate oxidase [Thermoanaerobaculia bacterium]|nr:L-aspartate oxidase [Thermoanaerobaculia bacterium]